MSRGGTPNDAAVITRDLILLRLMATANSSGLV